MAQVTEDQVVQTREDAAVTLPWYRSPLYISLVTSLLSQVIAIAGWQDVIGSEQVSNGVGLFFQLVALVAGGVAERARRTSKLQPIVLKEQK